MTIRIVTDSACDIPFSAELSNVEIMNFHININGKDCEERVDYTMEEFYAELENCEKIPTTAHITMVDFCEKYCQLASQGVTDVIHVTINKGASATHDAAVMARQMFYDENPNSHMNITVVDSRCYYVGYGYPIMCADKMINEGATPAEIIEYLEERFEKTEILLGTYSLKFMKKSGRISAAAAFAGELMGLRPVILMKHGKTEVLLKARGDKLLIPGIVAKMQERNADKSDYVVGYTADKEAGEELVAQCTKAMGYPPKLVCYLGSAVSINAGPHSIGVMYLGN
ncbi:MAG: DegV family protein [Oscillospiraceae bacterium]|nr:DegV family protein [Oscillospiraceae bacterium]